MTKYFHVERLFGYRAFYLMHVPGNPDMQWTPDDNDAFRYEDRDEAEQDATTYGGEVCSFEAGFADHLTSPMIVPVPALYAGHDSASRLAHRMEIVRGATLLAAE